MLLNQSRFDGFTNHFLFEVKMWTESVLYGKFKYQNRGLNLGRNLSFFHMMDPHYVLNTVLSLWFLYM